jgi:hypothetical protein
MLYLTNANWPAATRTLSSSSTVASVSGSSVRYWPPQYPTHCPTCLRVIGAPVPVTPAPLDPIAQVIQLARAHRLTEKQRRDLITALDQAERVSPATDQALFRAIRR